MTSLDDLYNNLSALEARLSTKTAIITGAQGVRIMRLIALMSSSGGFSQSVVVEDSRTREFKGKSQGKMFFVFIVCAIVLVAAGWMTFMRNSNHNVSNSFVDDHVATNSAANFNGGRIKLNPVRNKFDSGESDVKEGVDNLVASNSIGINKHGEKPGKYPVVTAKMSGSRNNIRINGSRNGVMVSRKKSKDNNFYSRKSLNKWSRVSADPDAALIAILLEHGSLASKRRRNINQ